MAISICIAAHKDKQEKKTLSFIDITEGLNEHAYAGLQRF